MIDWQRIRELRASTGEADFTEIVDLFLDEVEEALAGLSPGDDAKRLESGMHFLKGSALNLGFTAMSDMCGAAERAAAAGRMDEVDVVAVQRCYAESRDAFLAGLGALGD